jgi:hypothetical protein
MQITEMLDSMGGIQSMARELGVSEAQARSGAEALMPAVLGGFKKQAQPAGLDGLLNMVQGLGGGGLLDNVLAAEPTDVGQGNGMLGQIFGSQDVSRAVAQNAATNSGLDPALLKKMLPMLAMLVGGFVAKQGGTATAPSAEGGLGSLLGGLMGGGQAAPQTGAGGLASMLDLDGDGNPLDDIMGMARKFLR